MKNLSLLFIALMLSITSCKQEKKQTKTEEATEILATNNFVIRPEATLVKWTAYKTTSKIPVNGEFAVVKFKEQGGATPEEALNNLSFSIPISSLITNDATNTRDAKIKTSFFGIMQNTDFITGTIKIESDFVAVSVTMNGETHVLPMAMSVNDSNQVTLKGTMDLSKWHALGALEALNKVCFDLHKGTDGISKTWEDVAIEVTTTLIEK